MYILRKKNIYISTGYEVSVINILTGTAVHHHTNDDNDNDNDNDDNDDNDDDDNDTNDDNNDIQWTNHNCIDSLACMRNEPKNHDCIGSLACMPNEPKS